MDLPAQLSLALGFLPRSMGVREVVFEKEQTFCLSFSQTAMSGPSSSVQRIPSWPNSNATTRVKPSWITLSVFTNPLLGFPLKVVDKALSQTQQERLTPAVAALLHPGRILCHPSLSLGSAQADVLVLENDRFVPAQGLRTCSSLYLE